MSRILLAVLLLSCAGLARAQETLRAPVALLRSGGGSGAAIIVGSSGGRLYLITALHVIEDPASISLQLRQQPEPVAGKLLNSDSALDLAAISCPIPAGYSPAFFPFSAAEPQDNQPVVLVGHPYGNLWDINRISRIKEASFGIQPGRFTVYPSGVGPGSSGGAVLDEQGLLLGIVTETDPVKTLCLQAALCKRACTAWAVPLAAVSAPPGGTQPVQPSRPETYTDPWAGRMVWVAGGTFTMGSNDGDSDEQPPHSVRVPGFYLGAYEVTQRQWREIMGNNPSSNAGCDECPVEQVSWEDAQQFIQHLNQKTGQRYRLPTEAEWEYAAGGGNGPRTKWAGTNSETALYRYANFCDQNCTSDFFKTADQNDGYAGKAPAGSYQPNGLGLYDLSGNVWEWCQDWYHSSYTGAPADGSAWESPAGSDRVIRGGSWRVNPALCRVARRNAVAPGYRRINHLGFRLARTP
ncbi:MAG: SUMF1/EgtB/PvdO family nonheme iron enzyme [Bacteroidia bacterium]|nr:SUMF1/EgtB/PvdO family nonheme iron enzyme [Bacteroidia bacterium]